MTQKSIPDQQTLHSQWLKINPKQQQYVTLQKVKQYSVSVFKNSNRMEFIDTNIGIQGYLKRYLKQQCQINQKNQQVQFKYEQCVDFVNWMCNIHQQSLRLKLQQKQNLLINNNSNLNKSIKGRKNQQQNQINDQKENQQQNQQEKQNEQQHQQQEQQNQQLQNNPSNFIENKSKFQQNKSKVQNKSQIRKQSQDIRQTKNKQNYSSQFQEVNQSRPSSQFNKRANRVQLHDINDSKQKNKQEIKQHPLQKPYYNWQQYLRIIFDHFCKLTYAMGQDPTFDAIQHKSQTMTVNKFMIFCRDFVVLKMPNINRNILIDLFKKNSQCFKQMNLIQFTQALQKLGKISYPQQQSNNNQQKDQKQKEKEKENQNQNQNENVQYQFKEPSNHMLLVLKYLQIDSHANFKDKMKKVGILNYQIRSKKDQNINKKQPINYKFKFQPTLKEEAILKTQIAQRKNIRSQKKFTTKIRTNPNNSQNNLKKYDATPQVKSKKVHSNTNQNNNVLPPALPPPKKILVSKAAQERFNNEITGYTNIYKLKKQGKLMDASRKMNNVFDKDSQTKNRLKLNSIVQQARMQVSHNERDSYHFNRNQTESHQDLRNYGTNHNKNYQYSQHGINNQNQLRRMVRIRDSQGNYRQVFQTDRSDVSTPYQYGGQSSQQDYSQKSSKNLYGNNNNKYNYKPSPLPFNHKQQQQNDVLGLIQNNEDDEDQFLKEHLHRQRKVDHISKRINQKILQLDASQNIKSSKY